MKISSSARVSFCFLVRRSLFLICTAAFLACDRPPEQAEEISGSPDVFVIVLDAASAAYFGTYGETHPTSPQIDRFAGESVVFDKAYSQSATTVPSTVSLLTGVRVSTHQVSRRSALPKGLALAAQLFTAEGYRSLGFIGNPYAGAPDLGMDRGYESVVQLYALPELQEARAKEKSGGFRVTLPEDLNQAVVTALPMFSDENTFAYFHYLQPHKPYDPPEAFISAIQDSGGEACQCEGSPCVCGSLDWDSLHDLFEKANQSGEASASTISHLKTRYRANIRYVDGAVGGLLDALRSQGLYDESLIVLTADHGDAFFGHGRFGHNRTLYDDMVRIPLMMKFPRSAGIAPRRIGALVETVDVLPTLFEFLGFPLPARFEGESLWPLISDPQSVPSAAHQEVVLATNRLDQHAIRAGSYKYIEHMDGKQELYDVEADPAEQHDLSTEQPERMQELQTRLHQAVDFGSVTATPPRNTIREDPAMNQLLEALGYLREEDEDPAEAPTGEASGAVRD